MNDRNKGGYPTDHPLNGPAVVGLPPMTLTFSTSDMDGTDVSKLKAENARLRRVLSMIVSDCSLKRQAGKIEYGDPDYDWTADAIDDFFSAMEE
jgi:hypothetical protein